MGGKAAMFFALKYQNVLDKLIVADMSVRAYPPHHEEVLEALNAVDFLKITTRKEAEEILSKYISDFGTKQFLLKNIYWKDSDSNLMDWRFNLPVISKHYDNIGVEVPDGFSDVDTLFIRGEKSNYITDNDLPQIKSRFPNYRLISIPLAGHWVHAEKPQEFYEAVMGFIK